MTGIARFHNFLSYNFNSHAHVERDGKTDEIADILVNFNSHAHVERDLMPFRPFSVNFCNFNSHAHVERDLCYQLHSLLHQYFNSHAHVERDYISPLWLVCPQISTHTLTWSVTPIVFGARGGVPFQLTRSRGA